MSDESFLEFKNSFSYGSRPDLNFKFLASFSEEEAADFFQDLLTKLGDTINDGDATRLIDHVITSQVKGYAKPSTFAYDSGPFTPISKPVSDMRIGLITSTGNFVEGEDPEPLGVKEMSQAEAVERIQDFLKTAPEFSAIPLDTPHEKLNVRHGGYDIRSVIADHNVALPLDRMLELEANGMIGSAMSPAYSFVGATAQRRMQKESIPGLIEAFRKQNTEGAVLVPV
ncbi:MAG: hypothetical protein ACI9EW_002178 [Cellvibrionaceae bacterium]